MEDVENKKDPHSYNFKTTMPILGWSDGQIDPTLKQNKLAEALAKAQGDLEDPVHNCEVKMELQSGRRVQYTYADLKSCWDQIRKVFPKNGLSIMQTTFVSNGTTFLKTELLHTSGQSKESVIALPAFKRMQDLGADLTYLKRYHLCAIAGLTSDKDTDDEAQEDQPKKDGSGKGNPFPPQQPESGPSTSKPQEGNYISEPQRKRLWAICQSKGWGEGDLRSHLSKTHKIISTGAIPKSLYDTIVKYVESNPKEKANG